MTYSENNPNGRDRLHMHICSDIGVYTFNYATSLIPTILTPSLSYAAVTTPHPKPREYIASHF